MIAKGFLLTFAAMSLSFSVPTLGNSSEVLRANETNEASEYLACDNGATATKSSKGYSITTGTSWDKSSVIINKGVHNNLFDITGNNHISIRFSAGMFSSTGETIGATGKGENNLLSVEVHDAANDNALVSMRIETTNGGALNSDHNVCLAQGRWDDQVWPGQWIDGMATTDSSFYVEFSKENLFQSYIKGTLTTLDNGAGDFATKTSGKLEGVTNVYFVIAPDNGYTAPITIELQEINGEKLYYEDDGKGSEWLTTDSGSVVTGSEDGYSVTFASGKDAININAGVHNNLYNINNGAVASMKFRFAMHNAATQTDIATSGNGSFYLSVIDASNGWVKENLQIWANSGGYGNADHSFQMYNNQWDNSFSSGQWAFGPLTEEGEIYVEFSKADLWKAYVGGNLVRLDDESGTYKTNTGNMFDNISNIYFRIWNDDNSAFSAPVQFTLLEVNGNKVTSKDKVGPTLSGLSDIPASITVNEPFTVPVTASDLSGVKSLYLEKDGVTFGDGLTFTPTELGELTFTVVAVDNLDNVTRQDVTVTVVASISAPEFGTLPTFTEAVSVEYLQKYVLPVPTVSSELTYTLSADVTKEGSDEVVLSGTYSEAKNGIEVTIPLGFEGGNYEITYKAVSTAGETTSDPVTITFTVPEYKDASWMTYNRDNMLVHQKADGLHLLMKQAGMHTIDLGQFDLRTAFDVKPVLTTDIKYFEMVLTDSLNSSRIIRYRLWPANSGQDSGDYVSIEGLLLDGDFGHEEDIQRHGTFIEFEDCGWADRQVDGVEGQYHISFDLINGPQKVKGGAMSPISCNNGKYKVHGGAWDVLSTGLSADSVISEFLSTAETTVYNVKLLAEVDHAAECKITNIYGQSFLDNAAVNDAKLRVVSMPEAILVNDEVTFDVYGKDLMLSNASVKMNIKDPDQVSDSVTGTTFTPTKLGNYKISFEITGQNGQKVSSEEYTVSCKSSLTLPTLEIVDNAYEAQYDLGSEVTIASATVGGSGIQSTLAITVTLPGGATQTVNAGDKFTFNKVGNYKITYTAQDDAEPTPNIVKKEFNIIVPDLTNPVVTPAQNIELSLNTEVDLSTLFTVTDDSNYTVTYKLFFGEDIVSTASKYTFTEYGSYKLTITVTDDYENSTTANIEFTISAPANPGTGKGCAGSIAAIGVLPVAISCLGLCILGKKKEDK